MDYFPSQPSSMHHFHDEGVPGQLPFHWTSSNPSDHSSHLIEPRILPDDHFDVAFSPEQISVLLSACESSWQSNYPSDTTSSPQVLSQAGWNLNFGDERLAVGFDQGYEYTPTIVEPINTGSTTYRNGLGDPIGLVNYSSYELPPLALDSRSSPPPLSSSSCSPSDAHSVCGYSMSRPTSAIQPHSQWNFMPSASSVHSSSTIFNSGNVGNGAAPQPPIKKHCCQICGRAFQRQTTLTQHQITHTGERPYGCPVSGCDKAFTTASNAKRHAKTHYRISNSYHSS